MEKIAALEEAIANNNLVGIYSVFYTIAHGDPNFSTNKFRELLAYVKSKHIDGLMQEFDGEDFASEKEWNEDYWALVASSLMDNFCDERINHLEEVGKKVYPNKKAEQPTESDQNKHGAKHKEKTSKKYKEEKKANGENIISKIKNSIVRR
jgi:hypothetical protein